MGAGILLSGADDIDFMIHGVFQYELFGQKLWITTTHVCLFIVMAIIIIFCLCANRAVKRATEVPGAFQNVVELVVEMLDNMIKGVMGKNATAFANYIGTLFIFILISNISGLMGLRAPTADYGVTFALGLITFTLITFNKFKYQKVSGVIKGLCDDDITVQSLAAGKTVIIDGIKGTVTMSGENAFGNVNLWEFPSIKVGETLMMFSSDKAKVTVRYHPMWI